MSDDPTKPGLGTRLTHLGRAGTHVHGFVNPPLHRGSTVLQPTVAARREAGKHRLEQALIYGIYGGPTHHALEDVIAGIEGGTRCQIVSSGLAAVTTPLLAYRRADAAEHQGGLCREPRQPYVRDAGRPRARRDRPCARREAAARQHLGHSF